MGNLAVFLQNQKQENTVSHQNMQRASGKSYISLFKKTKTLTIMKAWSWTCLSPLASARPSSEWRPFWTDCRERRRRQSFSSNPPRTLVSSFVTHWRADCSSCSKASLMALYCCVTPARASLKTAWTKRCNLSRRPVTTSLLRNSLKFLKADVQDWQTITGNIQSQLLWHKGDTHTETHAVALLPLWAVTRLHEHISMHVPQRFSYFIGLFLLCELRHSVLHLLLGLLQLIDFLFQGCLEKEKFSLLKLSDWAQSIRLDVTRKAFG